ncbi:MAG: CBS domain-containing protein [Gammaproteobacteria bacterium]|nr:CBS domain-containing protein [Gammaproteobacteria bacterium]
MLVRNWMKNDLAILTGDTLVADAHQLICAHNLNALPVVEHEHLRGMLTRTQCERAAQCVLRTQNTDEMSYFSTRLKVKDIMVRNPVTVQADDTMEHCLRMGEEHGVSQFPVMDGERVVGVISATEVFQLALHFLGAWEERCGLTLAPVVLGPGVLGRITDIAEGAGAVLQAVYPMGRAEPGPEGYPVKRVILRFHADDPPAVAAALERSGYRVVESVLANAHGPAAAAHS